MSRIKGRDTKPEIAIRKGLHAMGFRYRLHDKRLPGKPDMVFPKYRAIVFVNGCFWHYHNCELFKMPSTRREWWKTKLARNRAKDHEVVTALKAMGWNIRIIWECSFRGKGKNRTSMINNEVLKTVRWLRSLP